MTAHGPDVVKLGGALAADPAILDAALAAVAAAGRQMPLCVVPGGGPFANAVRAVATRHPLSDSAAHWMAILGMDQYAHFVAERIEGAVLVDEIGAILEAGRDGRIAVLAPYRWCRAADLLPHTWAVTSDSIAATLAGTIGARRLVLLKPVDGPVDALVDAHFGQAVPADLAVSALGPGSFGRLADLLAG